MDETLNPIPADYLCARLGTASALIVLDVRRRAAFTLAAAGSSARSNLMSLPKPQWAGFAGVYLDCGIAGVQRSVIT